LSKILSHWHTSMSQGSIVFQWQTREAKRSSLPKVWSFLRVVRSAAFCRKKSPPQSSRKKSVIYFGNCSKDSLDSLTVERWLKQYELHYGVEASKFSDGTTREISMIAIVLVKGTERDDLPYGEAGDCGFAAKDSDLRPCARRRTRIYITGYRKDISGRRLKPSVMGRSWLKAA